jgi:hypothetical protein
MGCGGKHKRMDGPQRKRGEFKQQAAKLFLLGKKGRDLLLCARSKPSSSCEPRSAARGKTRLPKIASRRWSLFFVQGAYSWRQAAPASRGYSPRRDLCCPPSASLLGVDRDSNLCWSARMPCKSSNFRARLETRPLGYSGPKRCRRRRRRRLNDLGIEKEERERGFW